MPELTTTIDGYPIVIEPGAHNYSAYVPDLPGCVATGRTRAEVERNMREAIRLHLQGMREDNATKDSEVTS